MVVVGAAGDANPRSKMLDEEVGAGAGAGAVATAAVDAGSAVDGSLEGGAIVVSVFFFFGLPSAILILILAAFSFFFPSLSSPVVSLSSCFGFGFLAFGFLGLPSAVVEVVERDDEDETGGDGEPEY